MGQYDDGGGGDEDWTGIESIPPNRPAHPSRPSRPTLSEMGETRVARHRSTDVPFVELVEDVS
ncbi:hypothetical protein [Halospeciosus flavus]|uniref:Uncharacterized protein n=1 Tax=Halospeciosus flavus TaxID=3032283 RepID=A0ABD5Z613_9EURY|nr:hypothetical protein [Halospeciosus flavus]